VTPAVPWFGDPPSRRSSSLEPSSVIGDPPWFGSKKMKRRGREMGRDGEENVWVREIGKKMKKIKINKIILKI
jgi:hypothetical protein